MAIEGEPGENLSGLEDFVVAAEKLGVTGMQYERHPDGTEVIIQNVGEGWPGLGHDGKNLWLGLTPSSTDQARKNAWNENTILKPGQSYPEIEEDGLSLGHPLTQLAAKLGNREGVEFHVTGEHAGWALDEGTKLTPERNEKGELVALSGNIPRGGQIKAVAKNVVARWEDAQWRFGQPQRLTIAPPKPAVSTTR